MFLVHGDGAKPALPEMTGALAPRLDDAGIAAMDTRQRAAQSVGIGRHQDEMDVVRHQAPAPDVHTGRPAMLAEQVAVQRIVGVVEKRARAAIAALGHVMRVSGNDDASQPSHCR